MKIILLGPPGAGKGTQAVRIVEDYCLAHISTGDIFRANIRNMTELGKLAKSFIDKGELVPDDVTIAMVEQRLKEDDCRGGYLLDGFPRTIAQAAAFDNSNNIDLALEIDCNEDLLIDRICGRRMCECGATYHISTLNGETKCLKCGKELYQRSDDNEVTVRNRLNVYRSETEPIAHHYDMQGKLKKVDGSREMNLVYDDIKAILDGIVQD